MPLSKPLKGIDGEDVHEIPIPKDTNIIISIIAANRNPEIWGSDSLQWIPERWLAPLPSSVANAHVPGVYSHLWVIFEFSFCIERSHLEMYLVRMTFLGGGRACMCVSKDFSP